MNWEQISKNAVVSSLLNVALYDQLLPVEVIFKELEKMTPEQRRPQLKCTVSLSGAKRSEKSQYYMASYVVELFLYDLFLLLNLAAPGSCTIHGAFMSDSEELSNEMNLSSYFLELAWVNSLESSWPSIQKLPLNQVIHWKNSLKVGTRQIAKSRTERALFALLHVCRNDSYDPATLLWLSHSLEALFDTPVTLIGQFLQQRIINLLNVPTDKRKYVKKQCRDFYNTRSDFVHGSLEVAHPFENKILDPKVDQYKVRLSDAIKFGVSVCLATLQREIQQGWREVSFHEIVAGAPLESPGE